MESIHKQRLYLLILAGVALIALFLPYATVSVAGGGFGFSRSNNGLRSWGFLAMLGVAVTAAACFMGNKMMALDETGKKIALAGMGLIAAGNLIYLIRVMTIGGGGLKVSPGFGIFIGLLAGVAGLLLLLGIVKMPENKPKI